MRVAVCSLALVAALVLTWGCSSSPLKRGSKSRADSEEVAALKARIEELHRRAVVAEVEVRRLEKRVAELQSSESVAAAAGAPAKPTVDSPAAREPIEVDGPAVVAMPDVEVDDLPAGPSAPSIPSASDPAPGSSDSAQEPPKVALEQSSELSVSAQALYDRGYTLFHRGLYVDSETAFQQFLMRYSATVLGDNAQFWIGEARYARGDIHGALAAFRETASRFPEGNKVPDAGLKVGDCLRELGDEEAARERYRIVIRDHPDSAAAATALERVGASR